jgi:drug/metabolite transporter (DMT)-like permease
MAGSFLEVREQPMTATALGLVLIAAVLHATWNLLAKRTGGGAGLVWLYGTVSAILLTPPAIVQLVVERPDIGLAGLACATASALLHVAYFLVLQRGYRLGDLSVVYPIARGTAPVLTTLAAVIWLGERPSVLAMLGAGLIALGVFALAKPDRQTTTHARRAVAFGLVTGTLIAAYTICDKRAVADYGVPPLIQQWATSLGIATLLTPVAIRYREDVKESWKTHWRAVIGIAILIPAAYILVLVAMMISPVSYVAPAREISILFATLMGTHLLSEVGSGRRRAAVIMVIGAVALALG